MREFESGATRDDDTNKLDYEAALSPAVLRRYLQYMQQHTTQADNKKRSYDNWQLGIPLDQFMKSLLRHTMDVWLIHRSDAITTADGKSMEEALCACIFNSMGYLHTLVKGPTVQVKPPVEAIPESKPKKNCTSSNCINRHLGPKEMPCVYCNLETGRVDRCANYWKLDKNA